MRTEIKDKTTTYNIKVYLPNGSTEQYVSLSRNNFTYNAPTRHVIINTDYLSIEFFGVTFSIQSFES